MAAHSLHWMHDCNSQPFVFSHMPGFREVQPHPYWMIILPIATGFGFRAGIFAGLSCSALIWIYASYEIDANQWLDIILLLKAPEIYGQFFLFIGGGCIIGEIREVKNRKLRELQIEYNDLIDGYEKLTKAYDQLSEVKKEVDTRVTGRETTLLKLYHAEQSLKSLRERDIYPAVIQILKDFISVEACSIYRLYDNQLQMTAKLDDDISRIQKRRKGFSIMKKAIKRKETISMFNHPGIIISAPFMDSKNQVMGLVNIERVPPMKANPQTVRMTTLIAQQCASAIQNASAYEETQKRHITDDITGALTFEYFTQRLDEELQRSHRYKYTFSILTFIIKDFKHFHKSIRADLRLALCAIIYKKIRGVDLLFLDAQPDRFILFLPNTPYAGADIVKSRISAYIDEFNFQPYPRSQKSVNIDIHIVEYSDQLKGYDDIFRNSVYKQ
ncbi:MAG: Diguanylate cyclase [Candidatus Magnetoglobus multicellularis str. Araruama]|uniref:Diguanylate cyclase n=1 Tax=Candidatus Magnetoglobus multicellularis str. Araruama TaxID=890399 RepID=A0A1V1PCT6_9BACT|nr:MAG: Diguanylate cyclase [Candidatus Magnetoglobus multicellularis str. Araruama]